MLENNRIYLGDSFELDKEIPDKSVDMILEDMPYGITACKWDVKIDLGKYWESRKRIIKDNGAIVLTASQPFTSLLVISNLKMFKYEWIWDKKMVSGIGTVKKRPMKSHENVLIFFLNQSKYNYQQRSVKKPFGKQSITKSESIGYKADKYSIGIGYPKTIIEFPRPNNLSGGGLHPTQKPVALFEYLIKTYTNEGDLVFDGFAGSGTTGVACINTNRKFICIEKEQEYFELAQNRIEQQRQQAKLNLVV